MQVHERKLELDDGRDKDIPLQFDYQLSGLCNCEEIWP